MNPDQDATATPAAREPDAVEIADDENGRLHDDPRIPSRAELDALYQQGEARGWDEYSARAFEYLDGRREIADERAAALARGDTQSVARLDRRHALMDQNYIGLAREHATAARPRPVAPKPAEPARAQLACGPLARECERFVEQGPEPARRAVPQDLDWQRPSVPDDPARLRARIATLRAQRGAEQHAGNHDSDEGALGSVGSRGPGGEPREPDAVARSGWGRTPRPYPYADESDERRAQLARWADDDRHGLGIGSADARGSSDEDGA